MGEELKKRIAMALKATFDAESVQVVLRDVLALAATQPVCQLPGQHGVTLLGYEPCNSCIVCVSREAVKG